MKSVEIPDGSLGFDTILDLTSDLCAKAKAAGYVFTGRYLGGLDPAELRLILASGLGVVPIQYGLREGKWQPTATLGGKQGWSAKTLVQGLKLPPTDVVCDAESPDPATTEENSVAYINAWDGTLREIEMKTVLYEGPGLKVCSEDLFHKLTVDRYFKSMSSYGVPEPAHRSWCVRQLVPANCGAYPGVKLVKRGDWTEAHLFGFNVDIDVASADRLGNRLRMVVAD
jgi:hypothetical protein